MGEIWEWVRFRLNQVDSSLIFLDDTNLLYLKFPQDLREDDILWLLGVYLEYVEDRFILRGMAASVDDFDFNTRLYSHRFEHWRHAERGVTNQGHPVRPPML